MTRPDQQPRRAQTRRPTPDTVWPLAIVLALGTLALYWPATHCGFVNYDDDRYVTANVPVQNGLTAASIQWAFMNSVADNWHPVTVLSHMMVCQFCGVNPWGHHLVNVLLHAANAVLVFVLLRQLTGLGSDATGRPAGTRWRSWLVAALFAVHPLHVESVAWVAERKDVLSGFFGLLTLIFYTRYAQGARQDGTWFSFFASPAYWLAWFLFALGLMSKPMLVTWPFVLLLLDYWPLQRVAIDDLRLTIWKRLLLEKIPFFLLAAAVSVVTFLVQQHSPAWETVQGLPLDARAGNALIAYCRYLGKMFWPTHLAVLYLHPGYWPTTAVWLAGGFLALVSGLLLTQWRRHPYLPMGWLWFVGTLVPVIGLVQVGLQSIADRYTYLPSLGVLILVVWGVAELTLRWRQRTMLLAVAGSVTILVCLTLTWRQLQFWQDSETLFRHAVAVTENNYVAHYNLGVALDDQGQSDEAIRQYREVLRLKPDYARAYVNLGLALGNQGQTSEAVSSYQEAIRLEPNNALAHNNLGIALFNQGQTDAAISQYQEVLRLSPANAGAHNNLGAALYRQGRPSAALDQFREALRWQPDYFEAHLNLGKVLAKNGQTEEAVREFRAAVRLKPDNAEARDRLAQALAK